MIDRTRERVIGEAVTRLIAAGHAVRRPVNVPGIYYVDDGPELTALQLVNLASRISAPENEMPDGEQNHGPLFGVLLIVAMLIGLLGTPMVMLFYRG